MLPEKRGGWGVRVKSLSEPQPKISSRVHKFRGFLGSKDIKWEAGPSCMATQLL